VDAYPIVGVNLYLDFFVSLVPKYNCFFGLSKFLLKIYALLTHIPR
jgi:hypothetical protein